MQESVVCGIVLPVLACNNWESFLVKSKEGVNQLCEDCLNMWQWYIATQCLKVEHRLQPDRTAMFVIRRICGFTQQEEITKELLALLGRVHVENCWWTVVCMCISVCEHLFCIHLTCVWWLGSRVVSMLNSGAIGPGFKSQPRCYWVTVLGKLFTPIVPLFTKQWNW